MRKSMQFKARIRNLALRYRVPAQAILQNFMLERLLERIACSRYKDKVILKGGMLIASMVGIDNRTTMDLDATFRGIPLSEEVIRTALTEICSIQLDDEVTLVLGQITPIREEDEYGGYRVSVVARLEDIEVPLKFDITTGDILTPDAIRYPFHSNFEEKFIEVWAYNIETILAEKVETILRRSVLNTRPRDFYDVYILVKTRQPMIDPLVLHSALKATSEKRQSQHILQDYEKILLAIQSNPTMRQRWDRYCKANYYANGINFDEVIEILLKLT